MTNKVLRENSQCVVCQTNKSRFLKQINFKINNQYTYKNKMNTYCIKSRKDTENIEPKIVRTKNNRFVMQSKCSICGIRKSRFVKEHS